MIFTGENGSTWIKSCLSDTFSSAYRVWIGLGLKLGIGGVRPAADRGTEWPSGLETKSQSVPRGEHSPSRL